MGIPRNQWTPGEQGGSHKHLSRKSLIPSDFLRNWVQNESVQNELVQNKLVKALKHWDVNLFPEIVWQKRKGDGLDLNRRLAIKWAFLGTSGHQESREGLTTSC